VSDEDPPSEEPEAPEEKDEESSDAPADPASSAPGNPYAAAPTASAASSQNRSVWEDVRPSIWGIIVVLTLVAVQQGAWVSEPAIFGSLMDAVADEARTWEDLLEAMPMWLFVFALNTFAGGAHRIASERVYNRMYARMMDTLAGRSRAERWDKLTTAGRAELGRELVQFFEDRLPAAITDAVSLIGALGALYIYDWRICVTCFTILVPLFFIGRAYDRNVTALTEEMNALRERNAQIFLDASPGGVLTHFTNIGLLKRRIGNWHAANFWALRVALLIVFVVVLWVAIDVDNKSTGDVYAIVTYIWTYVTAIETIPELLENLTAVRDIRDRLQGKKPLPIPGEDGDDE
jgi:ABC-type multidrug transport system fused ATPase/permease subunit